MLELCLLYVFIFHLYTNKSAKMACHISKGRGNGGGGRQIPRKLLSLTNIWFDTEPLRNKEHYDIMDIMSCSSYFLSSTSVQM